MYLPLFINFTGQSLTEEELATMHHFALKVESHMTDNTFAKLKFAFPNEDIASWKSTKAQAQNLSQFTPEAYDCCVNSCVCYVGSHTSNTHCPYCKEPCFRADGKTACKRFTYLPIIPCLRAYYCSLSMIDKLKYRGAYKPSEDGTVKDVMDGDHYRCLCRKKVVINGEEHSHTFFSDSRDIMFGLSTDGFAPWKRRKKMC
ncbi:hypothetical protein BDP27DRAFT_1220615, partial [Rhodocollybia butyracea]